MPPSLVQNSEQVANGFDLPHCRHGKLDGKPLFDPKHQFGPTQAVDAQITLKPARRTHIDLSAASAAKFIHQFTHEREQVGFGYRPFQSCPD